MRYRPIVFSAPMVQALLDGSKTQTRRVMKGQPYTLRTEGWGFPTRKGGFVSEKMILDDCPHGNPGDWLWVREAWKTSASMDSLSPKRIGEAAVEVGYKEPWAPLTYLADGQIVKGDVLRPGEGFGRYRHARFMPRWASRITLEITEVRVQRLQDISDEDAAAEGITARDFYLWTLDLAAKENTENLCWIETPDGSSDEDYCRPCADKKLAEIVAERGNSVDCFVDGRWNGYEADGPRFCETCGVTLEVCYTDYAVEEELTHFKTHNPGPTAAYELNRLAAAIFEEDHERQFAKIGYRWLWESIHGAGSWDANPWVWALTFTSLPTWRQTRGGEPVDTRPQLNRMEDKQ